MNELGRLAAADLYRWSGKKISLWPRAVLLAFAYPGIRAVLLYRLQTALWDRHARILARGVYSINHALTGADLMPGSIIGPGLVIRHPSGIVVGHRTRIGANCNLLQGVTLGERYGDGSGDHSYPILGDNVTVGANASILGGVQVGDGAHVAAGAVVLKNVPTGMVAVGVPARMLSRRLKGTCLN